MHAFCRAFIKKGTIGDRIDTTNTGNVFGNITTSYGLDMQHDMCYATTGAVVARTDGGHTTTSTTNSQTNYTAPNAITTGSFTTNINWTGALSLSNETDPGGASMGISYDPAGRPSSTTSRNGATTSYNYTTDTTLATTTTSTSIPSDGRWTRTTMDGFGRTIKTEVADGTSTVQSVTDAMYAACGCSPMGKLSQKSMPHALNATAYWTVYTYDGLGRTLSVRAPDGVSTTTTPTPPTRSWSLILRANGRSSG